MHSSNVMQRENDLDLPLSGRFLTLCSTLPLHFSILWMIRPSFDLTKLAAPTSPNYQTSSWQTGSRGKVTACKLLPIPSGTPHVFHVTPTYSIYMHTTGSAKTLFDRMYFLFFKKKTWHDRVCIMEDPEVEESSGPASDHFTEHQAKGVALGITLQKKPM